MKQSATYDGIGSDVTWKEATYLLISWHDLHGAGWPVDLTPLESVFVPIHMPLAATGLNGYAMPPLDGRATEIDPAYVVLDGNRHRIEQRLLYAHEIGHLVCGHPGSLRNLEVNDWFHDRQEVEAWTVASLLLIPIDAWGWGDPSDEVAARCEVPHWLAKLYPGIWVRRTGHDRR